MVTNNLQGNIKKRVFLICNESFTVINFRKELILYLEQNGYEVAVVAGDKNREKEILELGCEFYHVPVVNRSLNPFKFFSSLDKLKKLLNNKKPDVVFTFQAKPNVMGMFASKKLTTTKKLCMVEGLGDPFQPKNFIGKLLLKVICRLYKKAFKIADKVFVLNQNDFNEISSRKLCCTEKMAIIPGIGIDNKKYIPTKLIPNEKQVVLMARLIESKGIMDYCEIARLVRLKRPDIRFLLCGEEYHIKKTDLQSYIDDNSIQYLGYVTNIPEKISSSRIVISCSKYKEGFPRVLLEAMALARPSIVTNTVGNVDAIVDGYNGYVLQMGDIESFANKIIELIDDDKQIIDMGKNAKELCMRKFDSSIINAQLLKYIEE